MAQFIMASLRIWLLATQLSPWVGALQKPTGKIEQGQLLRKHDAEPKDTAVTFSASSYLQLLLNRSFTQSSSYEKTRQQLPENLYQTADDMIKELSSVTSENCGVHMTTGWETEDNGQNSKQVFTVRLGHPDAQKSMMLVANTHAREAITAEVASKFIKWACEGGKAAQRLLGHKSNFRIIIVPLLNLSGRRLVDDGSQPCQRATADEGEGSIDLNRNMDVDFQPSQGHGTQPFSTYQARILRDMASKEKPVAYLDLHSGYRSLMVSWGTRRETTPDFPAQKELLEKIQKNHCHDCPIGANSLVIGYQNPGEIIDHMYAKQGIKYSTLWEIYSGDNQEKCLDYFNPLEDDDFHETVDRWSGAVKSFAHDVHNLVGINERSTPTQSPGVQMASLLEEGMEIGEMPTPVRDQPGWFMTT